MKKQPFVLVIEDAEEIASIFAEVLGMHGMNVEVIMDGAAALERLAAVTPDLVLLDMHLPNVSGLEILDMIRGDDRLKQIKVIAITANALLAFDLEDKADLTFIKPVSFAQISELSSRMMHKLASSS